MSKTVYDYQLKDIQGKDIDLSQYRGKKLLLVNTASACGFTSQYKQLEELHQNYKDKLEVIGIPCNDFGAQEPGTEEEIEKFCEVNFGVTFPLTEKVTILGEGQHPLYGYLTKKDLNGYRDSEVKWNFQKYLINEEGKLVKIFSAAADPVSEEVIAAIEK